ncbi:MAG: hypothetical protein UZ15_CFX003002390 [Chloroflexi bacterium OLB15]|nr:MAG: hypothetical protein UZ15_CFX003002390 [Chloroflexi bacterium OLB15]
MAGISPEPLPWAKLMRRIPRPVQDDAERWLPGEMEEATFEWMAPSDVVETVMRRYTEAHLWLEVASQHFQNTRWREAARHFLSGSCLQQFTSALKSARESDVQIVDVLRGEHKLAVRYFSAGGDTCLLSDTQSDRRMAIYRLHGGERIGTQDLGSSTVVYLMRFSTADARWKIDACVQDLPHAEFRRGNSLRVFERTPLPFPAGRDS